MRTMRLRVSRCQPHDRPLVKKRSPGLATTRGLGRNNQSLIKHSRIESQRISIPIENCYTSVTTWTLQLLRQRPA